MNPYQPGEDNQDPYMVGYKAGAASRDAEIAELRAERDSAYTIANHYRAERDRFSEMASTFADVLEITYGKDTDEILAAAKPKTETPTTGETA